MTLSKSRNAYIHVKPILDAALAGDGGYMIFEHSRNAVRWRMEAYQYRKQVLADGDSRYANLIISLEGRKVTFTIRKTLANFVSNTGRVLPANSLVPLPMDPYMEEALKLVETLDEEENTQIAGEDTGPVDTQQLPRLGSDDDEAGGGDQT